MTKYSSTKREESLSPYDFDRLKTLDDLETLIKEGLPRDVAFSFYLDKYFRNITFEKYIFDAEAWAMSHLNFVKDQEQALDIASFFLRHGREHAGESAQWYASALLTSINNCRQYMKLGFIDLAMISAIDIGSLQKEIELKKYADIGYSTLKGNASKGRDDVADQDAALLRLGRLYNPLFPDAPSGSSPSGHAICTTIAGDVARYCSPGREQDKADLLAEFGTRSHALVALAKHGPKSGRAYETRRRRLIDDPERLARAEAFLLRTTSGA